MRFNHGGYSQSTLNQPKLCETIVNLPYSEEICKSPEVLVGTRIPQFHKDRPSAIHPGSVRVRLRIHLGKGPHEALDVTGRQNR